MMRMFIDDEKDDDDNNDDSNNRDNQFPSVYKFFACF